MKMSRNREWLLKKAAQEDKYLIGVGGLAARIEESTAQSASSGVMRAAFLRLLQLARRERRLTVEQFAAMAEVDVRELVSLDNNPGYLPTPRAVHKLAGFLKIPSKILMVLAGLVQVRNSQFDEAALHFAANSESTEILSDEEERTLREYVKFLLNSEKQIP